MDDRRIHLVVVDDHEIVRNGLSNLFERTGTVQVVGQAGSINELRVLSVSPPPDVILLDLHLREGSGLTALQDIRYMWPSAKILILSGFADPLARRRAREAHVEGYILKDNAGGEIVNAVHRIMAGEYVYYEDDSASEGNAAGALQKTPYRNLGPREKEVLAAIARGKLNKEIAAELSIAEKSVRNIITGLFRKLHVNNRTEAAILYSQWNSDQTHSTS